MATKKTSKPSTTPLPIPDDPELQRLDRRYDRLNAKFTSVSLASEMGFASRYNPRQIVNDVRAARLEQKMDKLSRITWNMRNAPPSGRAILEGIMNSGVRGGGLHKGSK